MNSAILFDTDDKNIFEVDDRPLRAEALRHAILPKLHTVIHQVIETIRTVYGVELLDDSSLVHAPHFRQKSRVKEVQRDYTEASIQISGRRKEGAWPGLAKPDGAPVTIVPFSMGLSLDVYGASTFFHMPRPNLTQHSYEKFFNFIRQYQEHVVALLHYAKLSPWTGDFVGQFYPITPLSTMLDWSWKSGKKNIAFQGQGISYPVDKAGSLQLVTELVCLFPVYDSFIQVAKRKKERFLPLVDKLNDYLWENEVSRYQKNDEALAERNSDEGDSLSVIRELAGLRVKVMPAMRWQVFQRDSWRCVACGRTSDDGIQLHVDHIIPRSKGGKNEIGNYQTLCETCNIGKSNRDQTAIRNSR